MGYVIPLKVFEMLEEKPGKETASIVVEALEESIINAFQKAKGSYNRRTKKGLASKYDIEIVRKEIDVVKKEIELVRLEFKKDLRIATIKLLATIILLNQNSLEFLARILWVLK